MQAGPVPGQGGGGQACEQAAEEIWSPSTVFESRSGAGPGDDTMAAQADERVAPEAAIFSSSGGNAVHDHAGGASAAECPQVDDVEPGLPGLAVGEAGQSPVEAVAKAVRQSGGPAPCASPIPAAEIHDPVGVEGERQAAPAGQGVRAADRGPGGGTGEGAGRPCGAVEQALRQEERTAGEAGDRTAARPSARQGRAWPHAEAATGRAGGRAQPAGGCPQVRPVRGSLRAERGRGVHPGGNRGEGAPAGDPTPPLAARMRMRGACGSAGAPGAEAVPLHPLRDGVLGLFPVREI